MEPSVAPGGAPPWWLEEAFAAEGGRVDAEPLTGDVSVDVAIVGGGYTGLWTALAVLDRDPSADVAVLEAAFCGAGPSGRNGGFIEGYWPALAELVELFGEARAVELARAGEAIRPAVRALGDDVWLRESGMLMVATTARQERVLDRAVAAAAAAGRPDQAIALSGEEVAERCRSPRFRRGVLFPDTARSSRGGSCAAFAAPPSRAEPGCTRERPRGQTAPAVFERRVESSVRGRSSSRRMRR
jgi:glycine/D-amino acid oxidase-like deaminating enzyme